MKSLMIALLALLPTMVMAAEPLSIGGGKWYGGTYQCDHGIRVSIHSIDLEAINVPMFSFQMKVDDENTAKTLKSMYIEHASMGYYIPTTVGSQLPDGNLDIGGKFIVNPSLNGKLVLNRFGRPLEVNCTQVKFQFRLQ